MAEFSYREYCNYAYLGQWELARACAYELMKDPNSSEELKVKLVSSIQSLAKNPHVARFAWSSVQSPNYASFIACHLLTDLGHGADSDLWKTVSDFNLILEIVLKGPENVLKEFSEVFAKLCDPKIDLCEKLEISTNAFSLFKTNFKENPLPLSILINKMFFKSAKDFPSSLRTAFCDMQFQLLVNVMKLAESFHEKQFQFSHDVIAKIYMLLSILPDLDFKASDNFKASMHKIFLSCIDLSEAGILNLDKIYLALLGRSSPSFLKYFSVLKNEQTIGTCFSKRKALLTDLSFLNQSGSFNQQQSLLWILHTNNHFLDSLMDCCIKRILNGEWTSFNDLPDLHSSLKNLSLILSWENCRDDPSTMNVIQAVKMWNVGEEEPITTAVCKKLKQNVQLAEMCIDHYLELYPDSTQSEISSLTRRVFLSLQTQSFLKVVHSVFNLKNILPAKVEELLNYNQDPHFAAPLHLTDKFIYSAYRVLVLLMDAIFLSKEFKQIMVSKGLDFSCILHQSPVDSECIESDSFTHAVDVKAMSMYVNEHNCQEAYSKFIVERLESARRVIKDIYPPSFRIEILENIFSLLFLTTQNLADVGEQNSESDQGYEEDAFLNARSESFHSQSVPEKNKEEKMKNMFTIYTQTLKSSKPSKQPTEAVSDHNSSKSESASTGGYQDVFLCNELITRDLLSMLKDSVFEAKSEIFKLAASVTTATSDTVYHSPNDASEEMSLDCWNALSERTTKLLDYVNEALWRTEVVKSGIFQGQMSSFEQRRNKLQLQFSTSSSESTERESKKSQKRKRRKCNSLTLKDENLAESSFIQCMLSSPEALLRYSLWNKNMKQASQVIQLFNLGNTSEVDEFLLITELQKIAKKLIVNDKPKKSLSRGSRSIGDSGSASSLSAIKNAVSQGLYSSNLYMAVTEELSSLRVLKMMDVTGGVHHPELLLGSQNLFSILLIDLAYVTDISVGLASSLLDSASKNWVDLKAATRGVDAKVLSKKRLPLIRGNSKTLVMFDVLIKEMLLFLQENASRNHLVSFFWPLKGELKCLSRVVPFFLGSLDSLHFKEEINTWREACSLIEEFSVLFEKEELLEQKGSMVKDVNRENKLHITYKKLSYVLRDLREWSATVVRPEFARYNNYLSKLFHHLRQVTTAASECKSQNSHSGSVVFYASDFSILKESPIEILKKVILQSGISPERVESFAIRMKVDLPQVLAQACLPYVPLISENLPFEKLLESSFQSCKGHPIYILNASKSTWSDLQNPDAFAHELVKDLISMIQETAIVNDSSGIFTGEQLLSVVQHSHLSDWMEDCSQLAFVDLNLLKTRQEKLAFFINVNNIAWMYAILFQTLTRKSLEKEKERNEVPNYSDAGPNTKDCFQTLLLSPNSLERLTSQKLFCLSVGQLGPISLFDLRYTILHDSLPTPKHLETPPFNKLFGEKKDIWSMYLPPPEPRALFVLVDGLMHSARLQAIYSDNIDDTLENAMKDYLDLTVQIDLNCNKVVLPQLLEWFAKDFAKDDEDCSEKAEYEGLINLLSTSVSSPLYDQFQELLSADSAYNFSENIDLSGKRELPFLLKFLGPPPTLGIILKYDPAVLREQSSESNVNSLDLLDPQPIILSYLKEKCPLFTDLYDIVVSDDALQSFSNQKNSLPVFNLLKHYSTFAVASGDRFSWFSSALSPHPNKNFCLQQIELCFSEEKWSETLFYLNVYLEYCGLSDFCLNLSKVVILQSMAGLIPSSSILEPSRYALCLTDPVCRALTVLDNVNNWNEHAASRALKICLSSYKISEFPEVQQALKRKLKEISLCKKIVDASELCNSSDVQDCVYIFNNWQEVADCSVWGQARILEFLHSCERYDLAVEWTALNDVDSKQRFLALSMSLMWHLSQGPPFGKAIEILDSLKTSSEILELCDSILPRLISIEAKLFVVQYVVANIPCDTMPFYQNLLLGLKMLSSVKPLFQDTYSDLVSYPYLLLEQMLMNLEIKEAEKALKSVEEDLKSFLDSAPVMNMKSVDQLVEDYASKALEVHFLDALLDASSSSTLVLSFEDSIVADEPFIMPDNVPTKEEWVPDAKIRCCQVCKVEHFNMFTRRHHCRRCGRVVCANCSQHALVVEGYGNVKVRVCDDCYHGMTGSISVTSSSFDKRYRILSSMQSSPRSSPYFDALGQKRRSSLPLPQQTLRWVLTSDIEQNASIRNEFSYEQAPSLSLCYSILKLHSNPKKCAQFMLNLCDRLLAKIKPRRSGKIPIEVDYSLIISMIKSLLVSAKLKSQQVHDSEGEALADLYFQHLDVMKLLVNANCRHLLPREALTSGKPARKLRDKLLEEERMALALEVSTKFGLEKTGVWSSWGFFCIRAGDLLAARTKFQQCLKVIKDKNDTKQESPLLNKILKVLESSCHAGIEKASAIYKSLSTLKNISKGSTGIHSKNKNVVTDGLIKNECLYYLTAYGTHLSTVQFYHRNNLIREALLYVSKQKCDPEIFIDAIFMPMLKKVQLLDLKHELTSIDPTLKMWWSYLFATCRHLDRLKYLNVLYEIQLFMEDYLRAAKSAINFYLAPSSSYKDYFDRLKYLYNAKKHYETALRNANKRQSPDPQKTERSVLVLPARDIEKHIEIINLQDEVTRFLHEFATQNVDGSFVDAQSFHIKDYTPPTLFGNAHKKSQVAEMVLLNAVDIDEGFEPAIKIIQTYGLDATAILCEVGKKLVKRSKKVKVPHFLACVKCYFSKIVKVDEIILQCVSELNKETADIEDIIKMLTSDAKKIDAYLMCDKLKSAYLLAMKLKSTSDVQRVLDAAELSGQSAIQNICLKWLEKNG